MKDDKKQQTTEAGAAEPSGASACSAKVNWFADDRRGIMYVREWDKHEKVWNHERQIPRLSEVAQLLNEFQIAPNIAGERRL